MKTKKLLSILLAVILMIGCVGVAASAANQTVTVSLLGEKQAIASGEYEVILNVEETTADIAGGISCDVMYDSAKFEFKRIEISSAFAAINNFSDELGESQIINTNEPGVVGIVLLDVPKDSAKSNWLTLVFAVNGTKGETATFELENVNVSDALGSELLIKDLDDVEVVNNNIYTSMIKVNGSSIKKDGAGEIRFEAEIDKNVDRSKVDEVGFLMIPAVCLKGSLYNGDLTFTNNGKYTTADGRTVSIANGFKKIADIDENETKVYCYLSDTLTYKLSTAFAARAYVKMTDGTIIYSDNQTYIPESNTYEKNIKGGTSSKSCIETAKAIIEFYNVTDLKSYLTADTATWTANYTDIVERLAEVEESFN